MKRLRDESFVGSQFKRPFGTSRGESYGQPQSTAGIGGGVGQKLTTDDALQYLKEVKEMFQDQRDKYEHFLDVMKNFKAQRIDTEGVIARVKELFKGHNHLIYGFNTFLPKGFEITLDDVEPPPKKAVEFEEAIGFVNKIKNRFQDDDQVYKSFLDILNMYRKEHKDITEVYDEVSQLFEDHSDLLEEFTRFLPNNSSSATIHQFSPNARSHLPHYNERSGAMRPSRPMHMDKRWHSRDRISTSHGMRPEFDGDSEMRSQKDHRKLDKENHDRLNRDDNDREIEHDTSKDFCNQNLSDKRKHGHKVESPDSKKALKGMYNQEFMFCEKVKEKLGPVNYQSFLRCLHIYSTEIITRSELQGLVVDLLGKYPDLMVGFSEFLERCENIHGFLAGVMNKKSLLNDRPLPRQVKSDDKDKGPKREIDPAKEKPNTDYTSKSIQELDLSNCERCTPSYRLLPDDYPIAMASQRSEIGAQVLNNYWVSVTSGSEDYSFKHMRRNQYEESLFKCEDDRYELDMLLESVSSTVNKAEDLLNHINDSSVKGDGPIRVEDYFTSLNLRCIERLYGDHGLDAIDVLYKNPAFAVPVILTRLKHKQEEWTKCRADFNKVWAGVYAKNHFKSLDHRSFYFKQQDSKNLSIKSLVSEIKDIKESMQEEDDMLLAVAAGNKRPLVSHFEYEYSDSNIHEDLYKLIRYSCEEILPTKEQLNKVMKLWTTFLEPILGVMSRAHGADSAEHVKAGQQPGKDGVAAELVDRVESSRGDFSRCPRTNGDTTEKERTLRELKDTGKEEPSSNGQSKTLNDADVADRALERLNTSSASPQNVLESHHSRSSMEAVSGPRSTPSEMLESAKDSQVPKSLTNNIQLQSADSDALAGMINKTFTESSKAILRLDKNDGQFENGPEEGELSPNVDIDPENSMAFGNGVKQAGLDGENEDSGNASEGGDDVSGSESGEDECSREELEEVEGDDHDELEGKGESDGEAEVDHLGVNVGLLKSSERFVSAKPLAKYVSLVDREDGKNEFRVFYGNDNFYAIFRLHRILYERIHTAKTNSTCAESKWRNAKDPNNLDPYGSFMASLYNLLDGSTENAKFEDDCRAIIGNQSYVLFTLDKLIYKLVKQLQAVANDEMDNKLLQLYEYERSRKPWKFVDSVYHENARVLLPEDNVYRLEFASLPDRMSIQLMENANEKPEIVAVSLEPTFAAYLYNDLFSVITSKKEPQGIILQRNKKVYARLDEYSASSKAMEGVHLSNGLECKVACSSSKISYVLDTEDLFFRGKRERKSLPNDFSSKLNKARAHRFNKFLSIACK